MEEFEKIKEIIKTEPELGLLLFFGQDLPISELVDWCLASKNLNYIPGFSWCYRVDNEGLYHIGMSPSKYFCKSKRTHRRKYNYPINELKGKLNHYFYALKKNKTKLKL